MIEVVLALTQSAILIAFLVWFYFREKDKDKNAETIDSRKQKFYVDAMEQSTNLVTQNFSSYLKHIANLEKMVLPKPISDRDVKAVLDRTPPIVENDIERIEDDPFGYNKEESFARVPINNETQVMFEEGEDMIPTEVEQ